MVSTCSTPLSCSPKAACKQASFVALSAQYNDAQRRLLSKRKPYTLAAAPERLGCMCSGCWLSSRAVSYNEPKGRHLQSALDAHLHGRRGARTRPTGTLQPRSASAQYKAAAAKQTFKRMGC